ncbi:hypothetical protein HPB52_021499 [Rhipicephalus sanguineus]|uniref:Uncharacterized protein n=1 Tax=Rhipicephalus sanguineus TaxID=34632 RepID=A0A9D4QEI3_RHISA|nr:hypothetical protein HPB52_021499 [Rhipicephalus sanguineus]
MPGIPKVAYVVYNDGYRAIVDVKRIKDFSPRTVTDVAKNKKVYWKTEAGGKIEEDFFPGEVVLLGANFNDLVAKMAKKRWAVPDNIFYETEPEENVSIRKDAGASAQLPLPVLSLRNDEVHLGSGIFIKEEQWEWLLSRPKDSLFCKEATKLLWGIPDLRNRSLTGAPCRRFVRKEEKQLPPRRALTPRKLQAVANERRAGGTKATTKQEEEEKKKKERAKKGSRVQATKGTKPGAARGDELRATFLRRAFEQFVPAGSRAGSVSKVQFRWPVQGQGLLNGSCLGAVAEGRIVGEAYLGRSSRVVA